MQKTFCDRCGCEIKNREETFKAEIYLRRVYEPPSFGKIQRASFDLCTECHMEFLRLVDEIKEKFKQTP